VSCRTQTVLQGATVWAKIEVKTTFCTKRCWCHKTEALIFLHAIHIVAWLCCERVSVHVKSSHFPFLSSSYSILHMDGVSFRKYEWFAHGYITAVGTHDRSIWYLHSLSR